MADPKRSSMRRLKLDVLLCKKHPKHRQAPGVCSICLSEKLSRLSTTSRTTTTTTTTSSCSSSSPSSLSSYCSSSSASSCSSQMNREWEEGKGGSTFSFLRSSNKKKNNVLGKSRSMAFVTRMRGGGEGNYEGGSKKGGFWSKLLIRGTRRGKRTNEVILMHSRTMREMVTTTSMVH